MYDPKPNICLKALQLNSICGRHRAMLHNRTTLTPDVTMACHTRPHMP